MQNKKDETCVHFRSLEDCYCNNDPDNPGECIYSEGIEPKNPELPCPHYMSRAHTSDASDGKRKYQSQIDTAFEMGQSAAKAGSPYSVNRQANEVFHRICATTFRAPDERYECISLMRYAWLEGYEAESRRFIPATPLPVPKVILQDKRVQENASSVDTCAYWDWMDILTPMAASAEYIAGHLSEFQKDIYLERCQPDEKQVFEQIAKLLSADSCHSVCVMGVFRSAIFKHDRPTLTELRSKVR